jgi:hypothetical protein
MKKILTSLLLTAGLAGAAQAQNAPTTNRAVTITTGGIFQTALPAIAAPTQTSFPNQRISLTVGNNTAADTCFLFLGSGAATVANSIRLAPGAIYERSLPSYVPSDAVQLTCLLGGSSVYVSTQ